MAGKRCVMPREMVNLHRARAGYEKARRIGRESVMASRAPSRIAAKKSAKRLHVSQLCRYSCRGHALARQPASWQRVVPAAARALVWRR